MRLVEGIKQRVRFEVGELRQLFHNVEVLLCLWKLFFDLFRDGRSGVRGLAELQEWIEASLKLSIASWLLVCL